MKGQAELKRVELKRVESVRTALDRVGFLDADGAYFLVDGQYGSTGKGLVAGLIASLFPGKIDYVTSNAGPNSGHTSYRGGKKIVLKQLPTASVHLALMGRYVPTYLNAGAVIDPRTLFDEQDEYGVNLRVSPTAAIVAPHHKLAEGADIQTRIGSTSKGTGAALAEKIMRVPTAVAQGWYEPYKARPFRLGNLPMGGLGDKRGFVEVSQGHSLGINQGFYPYCTSRDCTVAQAMSDAGLHPSLYRDSISVFRTYPIRVGGDSGGCYPDQEETTWGEIGQSPEYTTVTNKERRVFTWSDMQFQEAIARNRSGVIFMNFMNYLPPVKHAGFLMHAHELYREVMGHYPKATLIGHGPNSADIEAVTAQISRP